MKRFNLKGIVLLVVVLFFSAKNFAQTSSQPYQDRLLKVETKLREGDFQGAMGILNDITVEYPKAADVYYAKALLFGQSGNLDLAVVNAEEAYKINPSLPYYNFLMELYRSKKDWTKGIETMKEARLKYPTEASISRDLIATYGYTDKLDDAIAVYKEEKAKGFSSDTLDVVLADIYFHVGKNKEGIELLLPWNGKSTLGTVYGRLAFGYLQEKKIKQAIAVLENGLSKTQDPMLYLDLADAYLIDGKNKLAFDALKKGFESDKVEFVHKYRVMLDLLGENNKAFTLDQTQTLANVLTLKHPRIAESHMLKGEVLWKRGNTAEARSMFLTAVGIAPNQIDGWRMLINVDLASKDVDAAIAHSKEALTANPGNPALLYFAGISYLSKDDNDMARQMLEAALNNSTNENNYLQSIIYSSLGDLYHKLNMEATSDIAYEEAIKLDSTNSMAMNNLAYYLSVRKKDLEKAATYSLRSNELEPNMATYQDTYAWVLFQQGNYTEALRWIEKAIKNSDSPSGVLLEHYADILAQLGRTKEAVKQWQKALTLADLPAKDRENIEKKIKEKRYVE